MADSNPGSKNPPPSLDSFLNGEEFDDLNDDFEDFNQTQNTRKTMPVAAPQTSATAPDASAAPPPAAPLAPPTAAHNHVVAANPAKPAPRVSRTDSIALRVGCEVGQVEISIDKLKNLSEGQTLQFNSTAESVYITVNGVRMGEGMLVEVEGKVGVKVLRWYAQS